MQHHEPESCGKFCCCCCYCQGQGHSEGWYNQDMTLSTVLSGLLIAWQPNLVLWYIVRSQSVLWKKLDYYIQGQGHSKGSKCLCLSRIYLLNYPTFCFQTWYCVASLWFKVSCKKIDVLFSRSKSLQEIIIMIKIWQFALYFLNCWSFCYQAWFNITYHKPECVMEKLDCCVQGQGHSKMSVNVCSDDIFWIDEPFTTKLGMAMHHCEPDCLSKRLVCCLQGQGHS